MAKPGRNRVSKPETRFPVSLFEIGFSRKNPISSFSRNRFFGNWFL
jgi:hypothetical protein